MAARKRCVVKKELKLIVDAGNGVWDDEKEERKEARRGSKMTWDEDEEEEKEEEGGGEGAGLACVRAKRYFRGYLIWSADVLQTPSRWWWWFIFLL